MTANAWRFAWALLAVTVYVIAIFVPEAKAVHLNEIAAMIVGMVLLRRPGDSATGSMRPPPPPPASVMVVLLALSTFGCGGSFEEARNPKITMGAAPQSERCASLDDTKRFWGGGSKFMGALGGGAGIAIIPVKDETGRIVLASSAAGLAAAAIGAGFISDDAATSWARECSH
jgi:hypothetical protein